MKHFYFRYFRIKQPGNAKYGQLIIVKGLRDISCTNQYKNTKFVPDVS